MYTLPSSRLHHFLQKDLFSRPHSPVMTYRHHVQGDHIVHDHDFIELVFVSSGTGVHYTPFSEYHIHTGSVFILFPDVWHSYHDCEDLGVNVCAIHADVLSNELLWTRNHDPLKTLLWGTTLYRDEIGCSGWNLPQQLLPACRQHLHSIQQVEDKDPSSARAEQVGQLLVFLNAIGVGIVAQTSAAENSNLQAAPSVPHPVVVDAMSMIDGNLTFDWTLQSLTARLNIERSYLNRLFLANVGLSPMAYVAQQRIQRAERLLVRSQRSISEIAKEVGWPDSNHFARRFKAHTGMSATTYRSRFSRFVEE